MSFRPPPSAPPPQPPARVRPQLPPQFGGGGFGPTGSGFFPVGSTPVPVRTEDEPRLPTVDDVQRKRPAFLVEGDDEDEVFGTDEFTAPPVIGG